MGRMQRRKAVLANVVEQVWQNNLPRHPGSTVLRALRKFRVHLACVCCDDIFNT